MTNYLWQRCGKSRDYYRDLNKGGKYSARGLRQNKNGAKLRFLCFVNYSFLVGNCSLFLGKYYSFHYGILIRRAADCLEQAVVPWLGAGGAAGAVGDVVKIYNRAAVFKVIQRVLYGGSGK
ncbi:MAG TPA: hypothetical protein GXX17_00010 [Clostridiales bacterium]|nr:hypothetical protein [Clostridiales bacterium]